MLPTVNSSSVIDNMSISLPKENYELNFKNTNNTKTELIRMLLEMTPNEVFF